MTPKQSRKLLESLPTGYLAKAQLLLAEKGRQYTISTISRVANAKLQNELIEDVLFALAEVETKRRKEREEHLDRILNS